MNALLPFAVAIGLLFVSGAALFVALVLTRRARQDLEYRVNLVAGSANRVQPARSPNLNAKPVLTPSIRVRRVFSIGTSRQWGMQANGLALILIAVASAGVIWLLVKIGLQLDYRIAIPAAAAGFFLGPRAFLQRQQRRAELKFMLLFPDAIDMIIRMLRVGLPIPAATRAVANESPAPVNMVFKSLSDRVDIGVPFGEALALASKAVGLPDFRFFSAAVSLQRSTGGSLASTLEVLAEIIRMRRTVRLRAQAMTGEVRTSAYVLGALPFLVTFALLVVNPAYLSPLITDPRGNVLAGLALVGLTFGYLSMRRMLHSVTMA